MTSNSIWIQGASENNLKSLSLSIPHDAMILIFGPSGSGKTTLAVNTIAERMISSINSLGIAPREVDGTVRGLRYCFLDEASKQSSGSGTKQTLFEYLQLSSLLQELFQHSGEIECSSCGALNSAASCSFKLPSLDGDYFLCQRLPRKEVDQKFLTEKGITKFFMEGELYSSEELDDLSVPNELDLVIDFAEENSLSNGIFDDYPGAKLVLLNSSGQLKVELKSGDSCSSCDQILPDFKTVIGEGVFCEECTGLGYKTEWSKEHLFDLNADSLLETIRPFRLRPLRRKLPALREMLESLELDCDDPASSSALEKLFSEIKPFLDTIRRESKSESVVELLNSFRSSVNCKQCCSGVKLSFDEFFIGKSSISSLLQGPLSNLEPLLGKVESSIASFASEVISNFSMLGISEVNSISSLSTFEPWRQSLISSALVLSGRSVGAIYVLDEPLDILSSDKTSNLLKLFRLTVERGNTLLVVGHNQDFAEFFDYSVELGPGGGASGGEIISIEEQQGKDSPFYVKENLTGNSSAEEFCSVSGYLAKSDTNYSIDIAIGQLNLIAESEGSERELLWEVLSPSFKSLVAGEEADISFCNRFSIEKISGYSHFQRIVSLQFDAGSRGRKRISSFLGIEAEVGKLYSLSPKAKTTGATGSNLIRKSHLYRDVTWRGRTTEEVLEMTVSEAAFFFRFHPFISKRLVVAERLGLSYLSLYQQVDSLSQGEYQRLRLVEKISSLSGETQSLLLMEHACKGLGPAEVSNLISCLQKELGKGLTVLALESNRSFRDCSDRLLAVNLSASTSPL